MKDLISKQAVITLLKRENAKRRDIEEVLITERNIELIRDMPVVFNVEKVMEEFEQQAEKYRNRGFEHEQKGFSAMADKYYAKQYIYLRAIDIVKRGGVE